MIDFRYHIVSLVAVFIALAVGIILGAGPLRGQLSDTLEGQVAELGTERNALRSQVELHERRAANKDEVVSTVTPGAVAGMLPDADIAVVEMPGVDGDLADDLAVTMARAGGQVVTRTEILDGFESADDAESREQAVSEAAAVLGVDANAPAVLAAVVTVTSPAGDMVVAGSAASLLEQADLISQVRTDEAGEPQLPGAPDPAVPDLVVVLSGGVEPAPDDDTELQQQTEQILDTRLDVVRALTGTPTPVIVVAGGTETWQDPVADAEDLLVAAVRDDGDLAGVLSSVDNVESATGRLAATWALAWLRADETGHYGLAADAEAPAPPPPPVVEDAADATAPGPTEPGSDQDTSEPEANDTGTSDPEADDTATSDPEAVDEDGAVDGSTAP
jgi:hypothetical protein